ncbi:MAG: virulence RhuM family protein, partial [Bacillaceae bacterium]|nr:virulence RhuM family protein [Bacillaceae bacterium]
AERNQPMYMKDWIEKLNTFLQFNGRDILENAGKVTREVAERLALQEYEIYNQNRIEIRIDSDFDKFIKKNELK